MIVDYIDGIQLSEEDADHHFDARMALARLGEGLAWLFREVGQIESRVREDAAPEDVQLAIVGGVLEDKPMGLLSCAFQWYAVSACNYAQLVGWLATRDAASAKSYVRRVIPRLYNYRNKVAAHFAITKPERDNEADLAASVMTHVVYAHGRLCTAALSPVLTKAGQEIRASRELSWSLTLAHERLLPRYWPNGSPKASQALRVPPGETKVSLSWSDLLDESI